MLALPANAALAVDANATVASASTAQKYLGKIGTRRARPRCQWLDDIRPLLCRAEAPRREDDELPGLRADAARPPRQRGAAADQADPGHGASLQIVHSCRMLAFEPFESPKTAAKWPDSRG